MNTVTSCIIMLYFEKIIFTGYWKNKKTLQRVVTHLHFYFATGFYAARCLYVSLQKLIRIWFIYFFLITFKIVYTQMFSLKYLLHIFLTIFEVSFNINTMNWISNAIDCIMTPKTLFVINNHRFICVIFS